MKLAELVPAHERAALIIADQRYLPAAQFVSAQILHQGASNFDVIVMTFDCTRESQALFDPRVKVVEIEADARLGVLTHAPRKSTATYLRLSAIESLRGVYSRLLYLDCDVWIGSRPICRLFELDMGDYEVAAVRDAAEILRAHSSEWIEYRKNLALPKEAPYFNTGILLIDVERFCDAKIGLNAIAYLAAGKFRGPYHDQSALNAILAGRWLEVSPLWNWTFATRVKMTERYDPAIIHFIGSNKPWKDRKGKHHAKYRTEMQKYLTAAGEHSYVEPVPPSRQWRRLAVERFKDAKTHWLGDRRGEAIDRFMATTRFADIETGIADRSW